MKKILTFCLITISGITFAMASVNNRDSFVGHYNSSIKGESNPTKATRNYECDLQNLRFETAKYATEHKFGDVIAIYNVCIQKYPEKEYLYNNRGNMYKLLKQYELALKDYNKAIELNAEYISPYEGKVSLYLLSKNFDEALKTADKALKIDSKNARVFYYRGMINSLKNNDDAALENYNLAVKYGANQIPAAYFYRGNIYYERKKFDKAISDYTRSLKIYESEDNNIVLFDYCCGEVYHNLGLAYVNIGQLDKALITLDRASEYYKASNDTEKYKDTVELIKQLIVVYEQNK